MAIDMDYVDTRMMLSYNCTTNIHITWLCVVNNKWRWCIYVNLSRVWNPFSNKFQEEKWNAIFALPLTVCIRVSRRRHSASPIQFEFYNHFSANAFCLSLVLSTRNEREKMQIYSVERECSCRNAFTPRLTCQRRTHIARAHTKETHRGRVIFMVLCAHAVYAFWSRWISNAIPSTVLKLSVTMRHEYGGGRARYRRRRTEMQGSTFTQSETIYWINRLTARDALMQNVSSASVLVCVDFVSCRVVVPFGAFDNCGV